VIVRHVVAIVTARSGASTVRAGEAVAVIGLLVHLTFDERSR
jgi:hypothetical protein